LTWQSGSGKNEAVEGPSPIRWGIIGTGIIASIFARDLQLLPDAQLIAVGSRCQDSADAFGRRFSVPHCHSSYDRLAEDPDVDVIYVATPHTHHFKNALAAIEAGKPVLCEKPFTLNRTQAEELVTAARGREVFLMEAMWTRFLPHVVRIRQLLQAGALGDVRTFTADHAQGFLPPDAAHRMYSSDLGGGALLDLGIYPVSFASLIFGTPTRITAVSDPTMTAVDAQTSILLQYPKGQHSVLTTTLGARGTNRAAIIGTSARIEIDDTWYTPTTFSLYRADDKAQGPPELFSSPRIGHGLRHEAAEVHRCLRAGLLESNAMPLSETCSIMGTMDEIRRQIGLFYPDE
jgi:predicted dehydrogenase